MSSQHRHKCATPGCPHYYVCTQRDCRLDWLCPTCEDREFFNDIQQMEQEQEQRRADHCHSR